MGTRGGNFIGVFYQIVSFAMKSTRILLHGNATNELKQT